MNNPIVPPRTSFTPVVAKRHEFHEGVMLEYKMPNGRGASVIKHKYSYGSADDLWELAVLDANGNLDYSTPVTSDVLGHLTDEHVSEILDWIAKLPSGDSNE